MPDLLLTYARYNRDFNALVIYEGGDYGIGFTKFDISIEFMTPWCNGCRFTIRVYFLVSV